MEFQQEYIDEVKQVLKSLEHSLMQLEKKENGSEEIDNVYRYMHTLKGSAGMFGFHNIEKLSHELESLFSDIREGIRPQDEFILDISLHAVDIFGDLIDGKNESQEVERIIHTIRDLRNGIDSNSDSGENGQCTSKLFAYVVFLKPNNNIFKRGVNFEAILSDINELGSVETIIHNESTPFAKQLQSREMQSWLEILVVTDKELEVVKDVFLFLRADEYEVFEIHQPEDLTATIYSQYAQLTKNEIDSRINILRNLNSGIFDGQVTENHSDVSDAEAYHAVQNEDDTSPIIIRKKKQNSQVSVSTGKLDKLIDIVSEIVTFRSELQHLLKDQTNLQVNESMEKLDRLTLRLRDSAFNIRLVPLNIVNVKLQRLIRTVSKELGKEVEFITEGLDTELDRSMINSLEAPLMHLIRNAIDHGIESPEERVRQNKPSKGLLKLCSYYSGDHVFIQIQDDGRGLNFDKIISKGIEKGLLQPHQNYSEKDLVNTMMLPGFSTAEAVTTVSGRGVGMDVVKKNITALRGEIEVSTEKGLGSIFTLRLPLTLTILDTLVVNVSNNTYLIPINEVEYCYKEQHSNLFSKKSRQVSYKGKLTPFVSLREYFEIEQYPDEETVIVVNKNDTIVALVVDNIVGKFQTVYKPLNELLQPVECFSGASILGDGSTALILNALKLRN